MRTAMTFPAAVEILYSLSVGVVGSGADRHERPHKPVLLLAVFDALAAGKASPDRVEWTGWLRERFRIYFELVSSHNDQCTPENPFFFLKSDGFWIAVDITPQGEVPLTSTPIARDTDQGRIFGRFIGGWDLLLSNPAYRMGMRDALVSRYFPSARARLSACFIEPSMSGLQFAEQSIAEPGDVLPGRNAGFRRKVVEIYDHQCTACGLRIKIPVAEISFVDAAHIVPFAETRNDHPANGLALCKNHHWALDQRLLAPDRDGIWRVSRRVESRRSPGEGELAKIAGQALLHPSDAAFAPDPAGLIWRFERLLS